MSTTHPERIRKSTQAQYSHSGAPDCNVKPPPAARFTNKPVVLCLLISWVLKNLSEGQRFWVPSQASQTFSWEASLSGGCLFALLFFFQYFYRVLSKVSHSEMFFPPSHLLTFYPFSKAQHKYHLFHESFPNLQTPNSNNISMLLQ